MNMKSLETWRAEWSLGAGEELGQGVGDLVASSGDAGHR